MREFGVPALAEIPALASLADVVFRRAEAEPGVVVLRRRLGAGRWEDVTAAQFRAEARQFGRVLHLPDALIAATAKENGLTLATRNIAGFDYLGVAVIDPWAPPHSS